MKQTILYLLLGIFLLASCQQEETTWFWKALTCK